MTQLVVALGLSWESQKSTRTWRPSRPPAALTSFAHALTAFTATWNSPGTSGLFTSAIRPTLMVQAVIPTSFAGTVPVGAADDEAAADVAAGADDEAGADDGAGALLVLLAELQPAASRAAAVTAISPARRARLRVLGPVPPRDGCSLPGLTVVPSMTTLPVSSARDSLRAHARRHNIPGGQ